MAKEKPIEKGRKSHEGGILSLKPARYKSRAASKEIDKIYSG